MAGRQRCPGAGPDPRGIPATTSPRSAGSVQGHGRPGGSASDHVESLIEWSLANRVIVLGLSVVVLVLGLQTGRRLPVEVLPDLTKPTVIILTEAPGLAPEEVANSGSPSPWKVR